MPARKKQQAPKSSPAQQTTYVKFSDKLSESLEDITRMVDEHKDMIDTIQEVALELTQAIGGLNTIAVKYAGIANEILDVLLPIIKKLPILPDRLENLLIQLELWTQKIIDNNEKTTKTIQDVQSGLQSGDVSKIKAHSGELQQLTRSLTAILPGK